VSTQTTQNSAKADLLIKSEPGFESWFPD